MDWRNTISEYASGLGRQTFDSELGLGIEYADGNDAFWVLPGEPMSTLPLPATGSPDVPALLAEYDRISLLREQVLRVLNRHCAASGMQLKRCRDGRWPWSNAQDESGSLEVGPGLTGLVVSASDAHEAIEAYAQNWWIGEKPSREEVERYLSSEDEPLAEEKTSQVAGEILSVPTESFGVPAEVELPELNAAAIFEMDAFAERVVPEFLDGKAALGTYREHRANPGAIEISAWVPVATVQNGY